MVSNSQHHPTKRGREKVKNRQNNRLKNYTEEISNPKRPHCGIELYHLLSLRGRHGYQPGSPNVSARPSLPAEVIIPIYHVAQWQPWPTEPLSVSENSIQWISRSWGFNLFAFNGSSKQRTLGPSNILLTSELLTNSRTFC